MQDATDSERFSGQLEYEIKRAEELSTSCPAIVILRVNNVSLHEKVLYNLKDIADEDIDLSTPGMDQQYLDFLSTFKDKEDRDYIGIIFEHGNGEIDRIKTNLLSELSRRVSGDISFDYIGTASYDPNKYETAHSMIEQALSNNNS